MSELNDSFDAVVQIMATTTMRRSTTWLGVMITMVMTQMHTAIMVADMAMATSMNTQAVDDQMASGFYYVLIAMFSRILIEVFITTRL